MLNVYAQLGGQGSQQICALSIVDLLGAFDEMIDYRQGMLPPLRLKFFPIGQGLPAVGKERMGHRRARSYEARLARRSANTVIAAGTIGESSASKYTLPPQEPQWERRLRWTSRGAGGSR